MLLRSPQVFCCRTLHISSVSRTPLLLQTIVNSSIFMFHLSRVFCFVFVSVPRAEKDAPDTGSILERFFYFDFFLCHTPNENAYIPRSRISGHLTGSL